MDDKTTETEEGNVSDVTDQRLTAVRQVSTKGWRVRRGDEGGEGKMEWILICLQQPGCPPRPHGRQECMENTSDGVAQTKHTLCE